MSKILRFLSFMLALIMSILFGLGAILTAGYDYTRALQQYAESGQVIHLHGVTEEKSQLVIETLLHEVDNHHGLIVRGDYILDDNGNNNGYRFGFYGNASPDMSDLPVSYLGTTVFDIRNINQLLAADPGSTLGLDQVAADQIAPLPSILGATRVIGVQLNDLLQISGTINGTYRIFGLTPQDITNLATNISALADVDPDTILTSLHGAYAQDPLLITIVYAAAAISWISLVFILILSAYQSTSTLGTHILLGWSRSEYVIKIFRPLIVVSASGIIVSFAIYLAGFTHFSITLNTITNGILAGISAFAVICLAAGVASTVIFSISPVNAVRNRISSKVLGVCLLIFYFASSVGIVVAMYGLDGPLRTVHHMSQIQQRWSNYSDLEILYKEKIGQNSSSISGQSSSHSVEYYNWYRSFEGSTGAYLVHTEYIDNELLDIWRNGQIYDHVPNQPYWSMLASPNYLIDQGLPIKNHWVNQAHNGTRVYLLPDTLADDDAQALENYLRDYANTSFDSDIRNTFTDNPQFAFYYYHPETDIFVWNTDLERANTVPDPVILLATTNNMIPIESESLWANGLENSYLKLTSQAADTYLTPQYLSDYQLDDNQPEFLPVANFIAGLQKTLGDTIKLFGSAIAIIAILELVIITSIVKIYAVSRRETIAVKRLLGHPLVGIFLPPIILVSATTVICMLAATLLGSTSGIVVSAGCGIIQIILLSYQARRATQATLSTMIKTA
ncbi:hypothetical protein [Arcanobacterium phocae]|uniref:hypothetical protein n=1 Tax=Arcanobacterium phocae TaxID=131112 RepID=UPI001C0ECFD3|nr:hypothetical protein [Arcanobacterium phocae]